MAKLETQSEAKRNELLAGKVRPWANKSTYNEIFIVPTRKKHDSGWMVQAIVGVLPNGEYEVAARCDDIVWNFATEKRDYSMRTDCCYPSGILHFWSAEFEVGHSLSSTDITVRELVRRTQ